MPPSPTSQRPESQHLEYYDYLQPYDPLDLSAKLRGLEKKPPISSSLGLEVVVLALGRNLKVINRGNIDWKAWSPC